MSEEQTTAGTEQTTGDGTGAPPASNAGHVTFSPEQQAHVDRIVGETRTKTRKQVREEITAEIEAKEKKAKEKAEAERLQAQQEYQKLAEKYQSRVTELEPLEERVKGYEEVITELLAAKVKELGEAAQAAVDNLPGNLGALEKLHWLTANAALFGKATPPQVDAGARGAGAPELTEEQVQEFAARMGVNPKFVDRKLLVAGGK